MQSKPAGISVYDARRAYETTLQSGRAYKIEETPGMRLRELGFKLLRKSNLHFFMLKFDPNRSNFSTLTRVNVQGVKSLGGHFTCFCRGFEFYEVKKNILLLFFKKKMEILTRF